MYVQEKAEMEDTIPHSLKPVPEEESSVEAQAVRTGVRVRFIGL